MNRRERKERKDAGLGANGANERQLKPASRQFAEFASVPTQYTSTATRTIHKFQFAKRWSHASLFPGGANAGEAGVKTNFFTAKYAKDANKELTTKCCCHFPFCVFRVFRGSKSINEHQHRRLFGILDDLLKLSLTGSCFLEFGRRFRHGFQEAEEKTTRFRAGVEWATRPSRSATRRAKWEGAIDCNASSPRV